MHGYDKYCQKRYSIIENYDAIARFKRHNVEFTEFLFPFLRNNFFVITGSHPHTDPDHTGAWNYLINGAKWWVLFPQGIHFFARTLVWFEIHTP